MFKYFSATTLSAVLIVLSVNVAFASDDEEDVSVCPETPAITSAIMLDLAGFNTVVNKDAKGVVVSTESLKLKRYAYKKMIAKYLPSFADPTKFEVLSSVYLSDTGALAVLRNTQTCELKYGDTDGEKTSFFSVLEISKNSVTLDTTNQLTGKKSTRVITKD